MAEVSNAAEPTVLVVDDEEPIRQLERRILESGGYQVLEAARAVDAFALLQDHPIRVDLLIADLLMPDIGGEEMARRIRRDRPDIKVLYVTGHIDEVMDERSTLWDGEAFLDKPFSAKALLEAVSLLLYKRLPPNPK
jgi:CheY-like chemotaxis protein